MWLRNRAGTEPVTARSPLRARRVLSWIALVAAVAAAVFFVTRAMATGQQVWVWEAALAAAVAMVAAVDLAVLRRRRAGPSGGEHGRSGGEHGQQEQQDHRGGHPEDDPDMGQRPHS
ncbi:MULTISPECIES: DUF6343 family protein [unclassified Nonomuraea]|uniref:DUF6343 family protein n=1 Tax=unclassified Nonomuraea TaxID=2593643 RepID=UPI0033CE023F